MRVWRHIILMVLLTGLLSGLTACQKGDPATHTLGGVIDKR